jgi:dipeptidase
MVAEIRPELPHSIWLTGTSHPCLSIYIPFYFGTKVLKDFTQPSAQQDESLWWRAEKLHRWINKDYQKRKQLINGERLALQKKFIETEASLMKSGVTLQELESFSKECLLQVSESIQQWRKFDR